MSKKEQFKAWLIGNRQKAVTTANTYANNAESVAQDYSHKTGLSIKSLYDIDDATLISEIARQYGRGGEHEETGNRHRGNWRNAIAYYAEFLADQFVESDDETLFEATTAAATTAAAVAPADFKYERDLQRTFCSQISALFPGYNIVGREHPIRGKRIDVLLEHADNENMLVVELKAGQADWSVFGQISMYIGMLRKQPGLSERKIEGVIIANAIDDGLLYACETSPDISVKTYRMSIELEDSDLPDSEDGDV